MEADEENPEVDVPKTLIQHLAGELWPPEVEACEHRKHHGSEHHVVEVSHHEVSVREVEIKCR